MKTSHTPKNQALTAIALTPFACLVAVAFAMGCGATPDSGGSQVEQKATDDSGNDWTDPSPESAPAEPPADAEPSAPWNDPPPPSEAPSASPPASEEPAEPPAPSGDPSTPPDPEEPGAEVPIDEAPLTGDPTEDDANLRFFKNDGFGAIIFSDRCVSKKEGEPTIETAPLPVGGGRWLECTTALNPSRQTKDVMTLKLERWCGLGAQSSLTAWGSAGLNVSITAAPDDAPWTVVATYDGEEILIEQVEVLGIGYSWPVGVKGKYQTLDLKPNPDKVKCDELFGL